MPGAKDFLCPGSARGHCRVQAENAGAFYSASADPPVAKGNS